MRPVGSANATTLQAYRDCPMHYAGMQGLYYYYTNFQFSGISSRCHVDR